LDSTYRSADRCDYELAEEMSASLSKPPLFRYVFILRMLGSVIAASWAHGQDAVTRSVEVEAQELPSAYGAPPDLSRALFGHWTRISRESGNSRKGMLIRYLRITLNPELDVPSQSAQTEANLLSAVWQLGMLAYAADRKMSQRAFKELIALLHELLTWLYTKLASRRRTGAELSALVLETRRVQRNVLWRICSLWRDGVDKVDTVGCADPSHVVPARTGRERGVRAEGDHEPAG
jgi:hypothetical protein